VRLVDELAPKDPHYPLTYSYRVPGTEQRVVSIGVDHYVVMPPEEGKAMVNRLGEEVDIYIRDTSRAPQQRLFMIEGGGPYHSPHLQERIEQHEPIIARNLEGIQTQEQAISKLGEWAPMMLAAREYHVPLMSPEPTEQEIAQDLREQGYAPLDIATLLGAREIHTKGRTGEQHDQQRFTLKELFNSLLPACLHAGWNAERATQVRNDFPKLSEAQRPTEAQSFVDAVLPALNERLQQIAGSNLVNPDYTWAFHPHDRDMYHQLVTPPPGLSLLGDMNARSVDFRNHYSFDRVNDAVRQGYSPFLPFGRSHTRSWDPAFAYLYTRL
ncbi:MAG: hypothetical protein J2P36_39350, partial [Ktedonobacteraceae bacterium]|nr:hypothetical protein [Ktedonobacteraceae bacterium]